MTFFVNFHPPKFMMTFFSQLPEFFDFQASYKYKITTAHRNVLWPFSSFPRNLAFLTPVFLQSYNYSCTIHLLQRQMTRAHSFPHAAVFRAEPWNLGFPRNLTRGITAEFFPPPETRGIWRFSFEQLFIHRKWPQSSSVTILFKLMMLFCLIAVADPGGRQIRPWPPIEVGNGVWPPSGAERVMIALWIWRNVRLLAPRIDVGYGFGPPTEKVPH